MRGKIARRAGVTVALALTVTLLAAVPAYAGVTVLRPKKSACIQEGLKVGVRYQGSGPTWFNIKIVNRTSGKTVFTRHGKATSEWKKWVYNVPFTMPFEKKYKVIYKGGFGKKTYNVVRYGCE
jgi:hypothetical protein